jgi:glucose/mannose-6-phosphate isomerase
MYHSDQSNFVKFIKHLPLQIGETQKIVEQLDLGKLTGNYQKIVLLGMGGSAIAGDLLSSYLHNELTIPVLVNRNYSLPKFVDNQSFIIASSYSGNTEETLSSFGSALERKCPLVVQTSGGKLGELSRKNNIPVIPIPEGFPPRQALGYMFFNTLHLLSKLELIQSRKKDINETIKILERISDQNDPKKTRGDNLSNHIAQKLYKKIPIVYTASEIMHPVTTRWRNQFNENSKMLSFNNVFPELNHNEIVGWEGDKDLLQIFSVLFLRDQDESPRNKKRLEITRSILRKNKISRFEVFPEGKSSLSRMFSLIYLGDWISYYLALLYGKDPIEIDNIDHLKNELSKF